MQRGEGGEGEAGVESELCIRGEWRTGWQTMQIRGEESDGTNATSSKSNDDAIHPSMWTVDARAWQWNLGVGLAKQFNFFWMKSK